MRKGFDLQKPYDLCGRCNLYMTSEQDRCLTDRYQAKRKFLLEYAESSLYNYALSEEAVQQTFEIACRKIEDFCKSPNPDGWLTKTLSFVIRNIESRQRTERRFIVPMDEYRPDLVAAPETPLPLRVTSARQIVRTVSFTMLPLAAKAPKSWVPISVFAALSMRSTSRG